MKTNLLLFLLPCSRLLHFFCRIIFFPRAHLKCCCCCCLEHFEGEWRVTSCVSWKEKMRINFFLASYLPPLFTWNENVISDYADDVVRNNLRWDRSSEQMDIIKIELHNEREISCGKLKTVRWEERRRRRGCNWFCKRNCIFNWFSYVNGRIINLKIFFF